MAFPTQRRVRVLLLLPSMGVGGTEQMVLNLCRNRDATQFDYCVGAPEQSAISDEIQRLGVPFHVGYRACRDALRWADVANLRTMLAERFWLNTLYASGKPFVVSLAGLIRLPLLPVVVICSSRRAFDMQNALQRRVLIPNGVDLSVFQPRAHPARDKVVITRVCRPERCAIYFWEAMGSVLKRCQNAELWIVGNNVTPRTRPTERVRFMGVRRDVPRILSSSDIFAYAPHPRVGTRDQVVLEALASGLPCVVSNVEATRESVIDGETGFLTPFSNVDSFAEKTSLLVEDAELRGKMGRNAAAYARNHLDMRWVTRRYETVYRQALTEYTRRRPSF